MNAGDETLHCVSAGMLHNAPRPVGAPLSPGGFHCQREYDRHHAQFSTRPSGLGDCEGRISLNNWVVFPYFDVVGPDDGGAHLAGPDKHESPYWPASDGTGALWPLAVGLLVVPGSHKAVFSRPRSMFYPYGNPPGLGGPNRPLEEQWDDGSRGMVLPDGCLHVRPNPGDVVPTPSKISYCIPSTRSSVSLIKRVAGDYGRDPDAWHPPLALDRPVSTGDGHPVQNGHGLRRACGGMAGKGGPWRRRAPGLDAATGATAQRNVVRDGVGRCDAARRKRGDPGDHRGPEASAVVSSQCQSTTIPPVKDSGAV